MVGGKGRKVKGQAVCACVRAVTRPFMRRRGDAPLEYGGTEGAMPRRHPEEEDEDDASTNESASEPERHRRSGGPVADDSDKALLDGLMYQLLPAVVERMVPTSGRQLSADSSQASAERAGIPVLSPSPQLMEAEPQGRVHLLAPVLESRFWNPSPVFPVACRAASYAAARAPPAPCSGRFLPPPRQPVVEDCMPLHVASSRKTLCQSSMDPPADCRVLLSAGNCSRHHLRRCPCGR